MAAGYTKHIIMAKKRSKIGMILKRIDMFVKEGALPEDYQTTSFFNDKGITRVDGKSKDKFFHWANFGTDLLECEVYRQDDTCAPMWDAEENNVVFTPILIEDGGSRKELEIDMSIIDLVVD